MKPSLLNNPVLKPVFYSIAKIGLFMFGWKVRGKMPDRKKFILVAAPHSTNWDFVFFLFLIFHYQVPVHWMGKNTMFVPGFRRLLERLGGIPIDRSRTKNTVQIMADEFKNAARLIVTIAPSGTRQSVDKWKTGFYRIALEADIPIVCGFVDYKRKTGGIGPTIMPCGDIEKDLNFMHDFYRDKAGRYDK